MENKIKVGDIFYDSWGYNMTIVDFYKVVRITPKGAEVIGIGQHEVAEGYMCGKTTPIVSVELTRHGVLRAGGEGKYLKGTIKSVHKADDTDKRSVFLSKWEGNPVYFNHCD